jgi:hypothetical protein
MSNTLQPIAPRTRLLELILFQKLPILATAAQFEETNNLKGESMDLLSIPLHSQSSSHGQDIPISLPTLLNSFIDISLGFICVTQK